MGVATQKEHREVATQCFVVIKQEFPSIAELLDT
jgi:thymidylate synthase ThyX